MAGPGRAGRGKALGRYARMTVNHIQGGAVGMFGQREAPITGAFTMSVEVAASGVVMFSLGEEDREGHRSWHYSREDHAAELLDAPDGIQGTANAFVRSGMKLVERLVPSIQVSELAVRIDDNVLPGATGKSVVAWGRVAYLASEWNRIGSGSL
jgi:hypothetical protein